MRSLLCFVATLFLVHTTATAQYAPQAPLAGHEGIVDTSYLFSGWATGCTVQRGWLDIADKPLGQTSTGAVSDVFGAPDAGLLSLGDSGIAVVTFAYSIKNGAGADFAVFENGFADMNNDTMAYLELGFVEVSSDGINFFRFPAVSAMPDTAQITNTTFADARFYHNLAGKYIAPYGTPFDLEELKDTPGLNVNAITHVRIIDVVGSLDTLYGLKDKNGHVINDPYPSPFPSGGFDLRAVGVIHSNKPLAINELADHLQIRLYPNPATDNIRVESNGKTPLHYQVTDLSGRTLAQGNFVKNTRIRLDGLAPGLYLIRLDNGKDQYVSKFSKQ